MKCHRCLLETSADHRELDCISALRTALRKTQAAYTHAIDSLADRFPRGPQLLAPEGNAKPPEDRWGVGSIGNAKLAPEPHASADLALTDNCICCAGPGTLHARVCPRWVNAPRPATGYLHRHGQTDRLVNHWILYPSADPVRGMRCAAQWRRLGYDILVMLDPGKESLATMPGNTHVMTAPSPFPGYYQVINSICDRAFRDYEADLVTCIGDDMLPPEQGAEEHTSLYFKRFPRGEGVMQCTGDRQGQIIGGKVNSERICGSPTFGQRWYETAFGGRGPFPQGFHSFFADECLKEVAERMGLLYQEPKLTIFHAHWSWGHMKRQPYHQQAQAHWDADQETFRRRKAEGFTGVWEC